MFSLLVQLITTYALFGLIWFVQVVHYPLLALVGDKKFAALHATRTTWVVAPLMLMELGTAVDMLRIAWRPSFIPLWEAWVGLVLIGTIWLSTAVLQVPLHNRLQRKPSVADAGRLVTTNWIRTVAWSARAVLVTVWAVRCLSVAAASLQ